MKANDILKALTNQAVGQVKKAHCKQLADIYSLIKQIKKDVVSVTVEPCEFNFGKEVKFYRWGNEPTITDGDKMPGERWTVKTTFGTYSQVIPVNNDFHRAFAGLLSEFVQPVLNTTVVKPDFAIIFSTDQAKQILSAIKFCSNDSLRPAMQNVQIEVKEFGLVNVVATDGTRLYFEQFFEPSFTDQATFLLPVAELKGVKKNSPMTVELFKCSEGGFEFTHGTINGKSFKHHSIDNGRFPNYMGVWPDYKNFVEVERDWLVNSIKSILPTANKTTHQINFYFNGCVAMNCEDLDFCNESNVKVGYLKKTTEDFEISFNGKFLLECLSVSKERNVKIYSNGSHKQAALIDNNILLMPVMKNQYA